MAILAGALILRVILAQHGGQFYFPDESRFRLSVQAVVDLALGSEGHPWRDTFSHGDHLGFRVIMMAVAFLQILWDWDRATVAIIASGIFSVGSILWIYGISRRLGAGREEARWAALLMAASNAMFYWASHLMPYDLALWFALGAMYAALHPAPGSRQSMLVGFLGFWAFVTYNGYWLIVGLVLIMHVLLAWPSPRRMANRALSGFIGLAGPMFALLIAAKALGLPLIDSYQTFSKSITQGDFNDGRRMIVEYLWNAESMLFILWLLGAAWFLQAWIRGTAREWRRPAIGLLGALAVMGSLVWFSDVQQKFVVYGRLIRQVVPFFSLVGAWTAAAVCARWENIRWSRAVLAAVIVVLGGWNQARPLMIPWDFYQRATKLKNEYLKKTPDTAGAQLKGSQIQFVMQGYIWPWPRRFDLPPHDVLMSEPHPLEYPPFLYEGFNREQRRVILSTDIRNQLILLKNPPAGP